MNKNNINRRSFLKAMGVGAAATGTVLAGCSPKDNGISDQANHTNAPIPTDKMTHRTNVHTGDKVSLLGFGCMRLPEKMDDKGKSVLDQEEINRLVDYAFEHGVNYYDTSPAYSQGMSEHAMGIALKRHPRDKFFLATKLSNFPPETHTREASIAIYHNSLKELQTDYLDYMLLHAVGGGGMPTLESRFINNGMLDYLAEERKAGRIRNLGFSYHGDVKVFDYLLSINDKMKWDFVQIELNYFDWKHATGDAHAEYLYAELEKRNIQAVIMEPLLGGRLARLNPISLALLNKRSKDGASTASWAFRFAGSKPNVLTVLSGMTYMEHLQDNIRTFSPLVPLNAEDLKMLEEIAVELSKSEIVPCTACKYCMPCPYGLNIPEIFAHYNRIVNDSLLPKDNEDPNYRKAREEFLYGFDRTVPKLRQANHCIGCKQCEEKCPQHINIAERMKQIDAMTESFKTGTPFPHPEPPKPQPAF